MFFGKSVIISEKFGSVPHLYKSFIKTNTKNIFEFDEAFFETLIFEVFTKSSILDLSQGSDMPLRVKIKLGL